MFSREVLRNVFCHSQWNSRTFISKGSQSCRWKAPDWKHLELSFWSLCWLHAWPRSSAAALQPSSKNQQVFSFPLPPLILSQFTQGMDIPIFWGSNIMTALDINVLTVPLAVVFQNNFAALAKDEAFLGSSALILPGFGEGFCSKGWGQELYLFIQRKTLAVARRLFNEPGSTASACRSQTMWEMWSCHWWKCEGWGWKKGKCSSKDLQGNLVWG